MHFVYKLDHLFQSTRVSDENSSVTKTFHFSKLISTQDFFCIQHATFKATYSNFNPFCLHLLFFMHLMIYFQLNDLEIGKGYNLNSEKFETWHGIIIDPHNICAKVERITRKTGCTSCTNWTISFKVQGFHTKTHLLQRHFIFLSLFQLKTFFASNMQHSKARTEISTLFDFMWYFSCI